MDSLAAGHSRAMAPVESADGQRSANEADGVASEQIARSAGSEALYSVDNATGTEGDPIDLTRDNNDQDMQKALMLSMQEMQSTTGGGVISLEDQELSRALEASLRENNVNVSKPMLALFQDPKNPHKRKRVGQTPVGLKNIGNTCWFSAVIQSLYHIPAFRQEILNYCPPTFPNEAAQTPPCMTFVLHLQKIFALLLKSNKMYIDPSLAIQSLQETFSKEHSHTGAQQDVSEFTHKLLEWIENAFKLSLATQPVGSDNPIVKLFNGHYKTEGINNDQPFISESDFGAYPIQVRGHTHLHDSLESATFDTDMQQQTFFTRFPPILVLELSRFQYNQATQQAEKIHDRLDFDLLLYVDRYLEENKVESCRRKLEVDQLRKKIRELDTRLQSYLHYQQRPIPITDVLSLTLAFVRDETAWGEDGERPVATELAEKRPRTSLFPTPRYKSEQELDVLQQCLGRWKEELTQDIEELRSSIAAAQASLQAVYSDPVMNHTPYHLHAVMVHQGQASGGHYWAYTRKHPSLSIPTPGSVSTASPAPRGSHDTSGESSASQSGTGEGCGRQGQVRDSTEAASGYRTQLETGEMYTDSVQSPESMIASYESPSVAPVCGDTGHTPSSVVGEGSGSGRGLGEGMEVERSSVVGASGEGEEGGGGRGEEGARAREDCWLKFNDVSVSEVSWEEVRRESLGAERGNTSAYCLVYINSALHRDWLSNATPPSLPQELAKYVEECNGSFMKELIDHDRTIKTVGHIHTGGPQRCEVCPPSPLGGLVVPLAGTGLSTVAGPETALPAGPRHSVEDKNTQELMQIDSPPAPPLSPTLQTQLNKLVNSFNYHLVQLVKDYEEPRPLSLPAYATCTDSSRQVMRLLALDHIAMAHEDDKIKMLAKREYVHGLSFLCRENGPTNPLDALKQNYHNFVCLSWFFVQAMKMAMDRNFTESLMLCLKACHLHKTLRTSPSGSLQPQHFKLLQALKCQALQEVSSKAYKMFEHGQVRDGIQVANTLVVPALAQLSREGGAGEGDGEVLERVREEWCQCLGRPDLNEGEQDQLGDLLTRILDDSGKVPSLPHMQGADVDVDSLDRHLLANEMISCVKQLTQQYSSGSFLGI